MTHKIVAQPERPLLKRPWFSLAVAAAVIGAATMLKIVTPPPIVETAASLGAEADPVLIERGKYVAQLGDCLACHTAPNRPAMAGGRAFETPFGTVYSTNITPDRKTGIGGYSFGAFDRAMRKGVTADGANLYPAMPYPSYAKINDEDMRALYVYLMQGLEAVAQDNKPTEMAWPFNMRIGLAFWNAAFLDSTPFVANPGKDEAWNRGAYLVQSLGHCGACHTPRGIGFEEKAMSDAGPNGHLFLSGAKVENWNAIDLRGLWTAPDILELLKTGQNQFATASGGMTEVIHHSTQKISEGDLGAIASYLTSLPADRPAAQPGAIANVAPASLFTTRGGLGYAQFCNDCHGPDGAGAKGVFPPLAGNPAVSAADAATLVHIMLTGWKTAETEAYPRIYTMPGFARLSDREIAEILTFARQNWGNDANPVTEGEVAKARAELDPKIVDPSKFDTPRLADMLSAQNAGQLVRGMRLITQTQALLPDNVGDDLNCSSCHLNGGTVADGASYVGVSATLPNYAPRAGKIITLEERINGCFRRSENGKPLSPESDDMKAMVAYFDWMKGGTTPDDKAPGRGVVKISTTIKPNVDNGGHIYQTQCAVCHGKDGEGLKNAEGRQIYPPLWGDHSFNIGAGMARTNTAAGFVLRNMPVGFHEKFPLGQGGLTEQEAVDVAEYFTHMPRPDFPEKNNDWPKGGRPKDARY